MKLLELINTWQGEGPDSGSFCTLIRFKKCNLLEEKNPCPWCDTIQKMQTVKEQEYSDSDIRAFVKHSNGVLITGGEPGMYLEEVKHLLREVIGPFYPNPVNVETNGYNIEELAEIVYSTNENFKIIYSPKVHRQDGLSQLLSVASKVLEGEIVAEIIFKFVVDNNPVTESAIKTIRSMFNLYLRKYIWLMPEGKNKEEVLKNTPRTLKLCKALQVNFSGREHIVYGFE